MHQFHSEVDLWKPVARCPSVRRQIRPRLLLEPKDDQSGPEYGTATCARIHAGCGGPGLTKATVSSIIWIATGSWICCLWWNGSAMSLAGMSGSHLLYVLA